MEIEKEIKNLKLNRPAQKGFDYRDWPIIKPIYGKKDFEIKDVHWEYIPPTVRNVTELQNARKSFTWLNAKCENLFVNEKGKRSMYREGAETGRIIILASYFFEWQHRQMFGKKGQLLKATDKIPHCITLREGSSTDSKDKPEYFFMAGVSREWENEERGESADTFAIVTSPANELMENIHNTKKRMPTILTEELAYEWLFGDLDQKRIMEIAAYQYPSEKMIAWPIARDFLSVADPIKEYDYEREAA